MMTTEAEARRVTDEAVARVERAADPDWAETAYRAIKALCVTHARITGDDVWEWLAENAPMATTHEPRALGAVMRRASRAGLIRPLPSYVPSRRPEHHCTPLRQWATNAQAVTS